MKLNSINIFKNTNIKEEGIEFEGKYSNIEILKEIAPSIQSYVSNYISLADAKAGAFIGILTGLLSVTYLYGPKILKIPLSHWKYFEWLAILSYLLLIMGIFLCLLVVWPRKTTTNTKGLTSWVHIANYKNAKDYLVCLSSAKEEQIITDIFF